MLAPDPALAGLLSAVRTATAVGPRATGGGSPAVGAETEAAAVAPAFELLADAAAVPVADVDGKPAKIAVSRGKAAPVAREPAGVDTVLVATAPAVVALPAAVVASAPPGIAAAAPSAEIAMRAEVVPAPAGPAAAPPASAPAAAPPASVPAVAPPGAESEVSGLLPVDGAAPPEAPKGPRLVGGERGVEAGSAVFPMRAEAPASPPPIEGGATVSPVVASALPVAAGWQLVLPAAVSTEAGKAAAPIAPEAVVGQVTVAVVRSGGAARKVELRLDPPELGRVEIHLAPTDRGTLHATVVAERADTHELLRRHGEILARELGAAGYSDVTLSFSSGGEAAGRGLLARTPEPRDGGFVFAAEDGLPAAVPPNAPAPVDGALDIRL